MNIKADVVRALVDSDIPLGLRAPNAVTLDAMKTPVEPESYSSAQALFDEVNDADDQD